MASTRNGIVGASGSRYQFKQLIQERPHVGRVWLATSNKDQFILKDIPKDIFSNYEEKVKPFVHESPYIRLPCDTIPGQQILVYKYLKEDFLDLVKRQISMRARKQILKASLLGIAELHDRDIVHLDIKPDNIMVNSHFSNDQEQDIVERVQIIDLENAAHLPKGRCIKGMLAGNDNWRSPEAAFKGQLNKPTDMFSFGAVCIYAVLGRVIFGPDEDFHHRKAQGTLPAMIRLQRAVSYFGDVEGIEGLLKHIADDEISVQVLQMLWEDRAEDYIPYRPFREWPDVEADSAFRDLVLGLMNLDPKRRLTARQALGHPWFGGVDVGF